MVAINSAATPAQSLGRSTSAPADLWHPDAKGPTGEVEVLRAKVEAGHSLTPVETGVLARADAARAKPDTTVKHSPRTVADFKLSGATKQDKADLKAALDYLQKSPAAALFLQSVPKGAKINIIHDGNDSYSPRTDTVNWDPRSALAVSSGKGNQSAALGLLHELDHKVNGLKSPKATGDAYDNTEEKRAITGLETKVAHELHEPTRTDHRGSPVTLASATAHTEIKPAVKPR